MENKKYLSLERLTEYDALIKSEMAGKDAATLSSAKSYTNEQIATLTGGNTTVAKATHATKADSATEATHATNADSATHATSADTATKANYATSSGSATSATKASQLTTARTISLTGDATGSVSFDGTKDVSLTVTVADDSHNHVISNVDGLQDALDSKSDSTHGHNLADLTSDSTHRVVTDSQISAWNAKSNFSGSYTDLTNQPTLGSLAAKSTVAKADLASDVQTSLGKADTALQSFTETDPTVPAWAKASSKPSYTASEVGAVPTSRKVNGKALSADITIAAADISDVYSKTEVDNKVSSAISTHNSATDAHNDIRTTLAAVKEDVDAFFKDATISTEAKDTLKEIQDYITSDVSAAAEMTASINNKVDKVSGKGLSTNDLTATLKANYDAAYSHTSNKENPHGVTKTQIGLGNVENKSSATIRSELTKENVTTALGYTPSETDTVYTHPTYTVKQTASSADPDHGQGFIVVGDITTNNLGHITGVDYQSVTLPSYKAATTSKDGLMSASDKSKLDNLDTIEVSASQDHTAFLFLKWYILPEVFYRLSLSATASS